MIGLIYIGWFPNGKGYCGKTTDFELRKDRHKKDAEGGGKWLMSRAIRKWGWDSIRWEIVYDNVPIEDLDRLEIETIVWFGFYGKNGYNMTPGGDGGPTRFGPHKEESKKKMSEVLLSPEVNVKLRTSKRKSTTRSGSMKKRWEDQSYKERVVGHRIGLKRSDETKRKMSLSGRKRFEDPEERRRMSLAMKCRKLPPDFGRKISLAKKGKLPTEKQLAAIALVAKINTGKKRSPGAVENLREGAKKGWITRRNNRDQRPSSGRTEQ